MNILTERLDRLRVLLHEHNLDALLITSGANRRYLSEFTGSTGALLVTHSQKIIFTDFRYRLQVQQEAPTCTLREISSETPLAKVLPDTAAELGLHTLGFEASYLSVAQHTQFVEAFQEASVPLKPELVPVTGLVESLREVKDATELATLRRASALTDAALAAVLPLLRPEQSERQVAWMLEVAIHEQGADGVAFPIIVAAGPRAALPHAHPSDALLGTGQPVIIDMGATYQGYHADLTRTVVLGEPDERFWHVYKAVLAAQQQAINRLRAGITAAEADAFARDFLRAAGFGEAFGHSLGHGVGLEVHEEPALRSTSDKPLQSGSVFSVEPGVYLSDWGGVRVEDLVMLQDQSCEVLSQAPHQPEIPYKD